MPRRKPKQEKDNSERWLLTYSDLMNLLLILFIILFAMSTVNQQKVEQLARSIRESMGIVTTGGQGVMGGAVDANSLISLPYNAPSPVIPSTVEEAQLGQVKDQVDNLIKENNLGGNISVDMTERGIKISVTSQLLFKSGSADIEPNSKPTIAEIGQILKKVPGRTLRVEGHTDNDPIHTYLFPDNWALSSARATNILRLLVNQVGIDPKKISATGYGEFFPLYPNDTPQHKAANRRVDIIILKSMYDKGEPSDNKN